MAQVAFDTLQFVETLEPSGPPKEQARAISLAVRQSHEAVDVATRADITDLKRYLSESHHGLSAEIADVRKDLSAEITDVREDMTARFEKMELRMTVKLGVMMAAAAGIITAMLRIPV